MVGLVMRVGVVAVGGVDGCCGVVTGGGVTSKHVIHGWCCVVAVGGVGGGDMVAKNGRENKEKILERDEMI